jgi:hypothetical protein
MARHLWHLITSQMLKEGATLLEHELAEPSGVVG